MNSIGRGELQYKHYKFWSKLIYLACCNVSYIYLNHFYSLKSASKFLCAVGFLLSLLVRPTIQLLLNHLPGVLSPFWSEFSHTFLFIILAFSHPSVPLDVVVFEALLLLFPLRRSPRSFTTVRVDLVVKIFEAWDVLLISYSVKYFRINTKLVPVLWPKIK